MTTELKNDTLIRALLREPVDRTPVWIMRQAGRYLPEYLKTRAEAGSFMNLCQNPELACEVTMQPLRRFNLDAAIVFSDILTIPDVMGMNLYFEDGVGPKFANPITSTADIHNLPRPDVGRIPGLCHGCRVPGTPGTGRQGTTYRLQWQSLDLAHLYDRRRSQQDVLQVQETDLPGTSAGPYAAGETV